MKPVTMVAAAALGIGAQAQQLVHFHHVHLNSTNPDAAIEFYTKHFSSSNARLSTLINARGMKEFTSAALYPPENYVNP